VIRDAKTATAAKALQDNACMVEKVISSAFTGHA
jgi:hypothetical protein